MESYITLFDKKIGDISNIENEFGIEIEKNEEKHEIKCELIHSVCNCKRNGSEELKDNIENYRRVYDCDKDRKCTICRDKFGDGNVVGSYGCTHDYHFEWIKKWLERNNDCPLCIESWKFDNDKDPVYVHYNNKTIRFDKKISKNEIKIFSNTKTVIK